MFLFKINVNFLNMNNILSLDYSYIIKYKYALIV